jgi:hypothetical protein
MNKEQIRKTIVAITNEQKIEKRSSFFLEKKTLATTSENE